MTEPALRDLTVEDLDEVMAIESRSFAEPWTRGVFEEALGSDISEAMGLEKEGRLIGYFVFYRVDAEAHILNLAIHPSCRRRGFGFAMLKKALSALGARGVTTFFLEVREGNSGAIGLYERCGFQRIGRRKRYYTETNEDALVMCRCLSGKDAVHG